MLVSETSTLIGVSAGAGVGTGAGNAPRLSKVIYRYVPSPNTPARVLIPGKYRKKFALKSSSKVKVLSLNSESIILL